MYCNKCGLAISDSNKFCPNCGNMIHPSQKKNPKNKIIISVIVLIIILLIVVAVILNFSKSVNNAYVGEWETSGGTYFIFTSDNMGYWYKSKADTDDNYYKGSIKTFNGEKAISYLKLTTSQVNTVISNSNGKIIEDDIYALEFCPTEFIVQGEDMSNSLNNSCFKYVFVSINENMAQMGNYNSGDKYDLTRIK